MRILILAALESELRPFLGVIKPEELKRHKQQTLYSFVDEHLIVDIGLTGVGCKNCRIFFKTMAIDPALYELILSTGYAGAVREGYKAGDLIAADKIFCDGDKPAWTVGKEDFISAAGAVYTAGITVKTFVAEESKRQISRDRPEIGFVDMESSEIIKIAAESNVKCSVIRAVSDPLGMALPPAPFIQDSWEYLPKKEFILACLRDPSVLIRFIRLQYALKKAAGSISKALLTILTILRNNHADKGHKY